MASRSTICLDLLLGLALTSIYYARHLFVSHNSRNSAVDGRYIFAVRNGVVQPVAPEPSSLAVFGTGMLGLAGLRRRKQKKS